MPQLGRQTPRSQDLGFHTHLLVDARSDKLGSYVDQPTNRLAKRRCIALAEEDEVMESLSNTVHNSPSYLMGAEDNQPDKDGHVQHS